MDVLRMGNEFNLKMNGNRKNQVHNKNDVPRMVEWIGAVWANANDSKCVFPRPVWSR
jgi:hypothetical protein